DAGGRAQGRPSRQPDRDLSGAARRGPAPAGAALVRPAQPVRPSGARHAADARALLRRRFPDRPSLRHARRPPAVGDAAVVARTVSAVTPRPTLLVIFGPTGAGKSDVAHAAARRLGGEIVSADAFAVYRGLDVGTDKPSPERRREGPYHLVDVAEPEGAFSAGRWAQAARAALEDAVGRGRLPIGCGGSGFYVSALLDGLPEGEARDEALRRALASWAKLRGPAAAHRFLERNDPIAASRIPPGNLRYTLRALEILLLT